MTNTRKDGTEMDDLIDKYPRLFKGRAPRIPSHVLPGWAVLIDRLCADIDALLNDAQAAAFEVDQVKEKFGQLRFYFSLHRQADTRVDLIADDGVTSLVGQVHGEDDTLRQRLRELVTAAEDASATLCAVCGEVGRGRNQGGYLTVLCDVHARQGGRA